MAAKSAETKKTSDKGTQQPKTTEQKNAERKLKVDVLNQKDELRDLIKDLLSGHTATAEQLNSLRKVNAAIKAALDLSSEAPKSE